MIRSSPLDFATESGVCPRLPFASTSAPALSSVSITLKSCISTARIIGVFPARHFALKSAPASRSILTSLSLRLNTAFISGLPPPSLRRALMSPPLVRRSFKSGSLLQLVARNIRLIPPVPGRVTFAPLRISSSATARYCGAQKKDKIDSPKSIMLDCLEGIVGVRRTVWCMFPDIRICSRVQQESCHVDAVENPRGHFERQHTALHGDHIVQSGKTWI